MSQEMLSDCPDVVVTAGPTMEPIDDIRFVSNVSTGSFGHALATEYATMGYRVLLLASELVDGRFDVPDGIERQTFTSAESLRQRLLSVPATRLVLQAAAVADFTPSEPVRGKLSSDAPCLDIHQVPVPKILPMLRGHFGPDTTIVGFKLLSGAPHDELMEAAAKQIDIAKTDLCIANDLQDIGDKRTVYLVRGNGSVTTIKGETTTVARRIASQVWPAKAQNV